MLLESDDNGWPTRRGEARVICEAHYKILCNSVGLACIGTYCTAMIILVSSQRHNDD